LLVIGLLLAGVYVARTPWMLHIGGRSTPLTVWEGFGPVEASNGGRYVLYIKFQGGAETGSGRHTIHAFGVRSDNMKGSALLCTRSGVTHTFDLAGVIDGWWSTDGAPTSVGLTHGKPVRLPGGWVISLHGVWHGPELQLTSPDNSFTEVLTPRGEIRHTTSTADAGTARATLTYGSRADFEAACRALQGG
jgi:hypothetical protein